MVDRDGSAAHLRRMVLVVGGLSALLGWKLGAALVAHPDTCHYVSVAEHLAAGDGLVTSVVQWGTEHFAPMTTYPPAFPAAAAVLRWAGLPVRQGMALVLGASFVVYAALTCLLFAGLFRSRRAWLAPLLSFAVLIQPGVLNGLRSALSDLPSGALTLGAIVFALRFGGRSRWHDLGLGVLLGAGVATRWAGLYFAAAFLLIGVLVGWRGRATLRDRLEAAAWVLGGVAAVVAPLWMRNLAVAGNAMGARPAIATPVAAHVSQAWLGLTDWFQVASVALPPGLRGAHAALALLALLLAAASGIRNRSRPAAILTLVVAVYLVLMVASASRTSIDPLSRQRFWLGIYPVTFAAFVAALVEGTAWRWPRRVGAALGAAVLLQASHTFAGDVASRLQTGPRPGGYFDPVFARSALLAGALRDSDAGRCYLVANDARPLLPRLGARPIRPFPGDALQLQRPDGTRPCIVLFAPKHLTGKPRNAYGVVKKKVASVAPLLGLVRAGADSVAEVWTPAPRTSPP